MDRLGQASKAASSTKATVELVRTKVRRVAVVGGLMAAKL
jgi:hypothetical protein